MMRAIAIAATAVMCAACAGHDQQSDGVGAPNVTPAGIVDKLNKEITAALADPKMKASISDMGAAPFVSSPADFGKFIADETEKWGKVIRAANIKGE